MFVVFRISYSTKKMRDYVFNIYIFGIGIYAVFLEKDIFIYKKLMLSFKYFNE